LVLDPKHTGIPLNFMIHPYVEVDGDKFSEVKTKYTYSE